MKAAARLGLALATAVLVAGCDPIMNMNGVVRTVPENPASAETDPYAGGVAIAGAEVTMRCPDAEPAELAVTGDDGRIEYGTIGLWPMDCTVRVEAPDYHPQTFAIEELCVARSGTSCHYIAIFAELLPRASTSETSSRKP